jgi:hypothetical protein
MAKDEGTEYHVYLTGGNVFRTGGFETVGSLRKTLLRRDDVAGTFRGKPRAPWYPTVIEPKHIVAIVDVRASVKEHSS